MSDDCAACGYGRTATTVNLTDTSGGVLIDLCRECRRSIGRRDERFGSGCVFCGSRAPTSRSTGIVYPEGDAGEGCHVCDRCRGALLDRGQAPRRPADRREGHGLEPGDRVVDRDDEAENPSQAVVLRLRDRADEVEVPVGGGTTVAALNRDYPSDATVGVVAFKTNLGRELDEWRNVSPGTLLEEVALAGVQTYSYPTPRLELVEGRAMWWRAGMEAFK